MFNFSLPVERGNILKLTSHDTINLPRHEGTFKRVWHKSQKKGILDGLWVYDFFFPFTSFSIINQVNGREAQVPRLKNCNIDPYLSFLSVKARSIRMFDENN